ncbi:MULTISPECIES: hypothetical protein [Kitasatospora]|uniref:Uncharacterized protein n=1 Tax=Kitasatospora setae (strain ATCC 33774 / DSM 43861 / JCM 3304 / KCC A-0304 / NBRC 14216 / KM-6054) TaxID=452652 RepID=E4NJ22_KITSK|nr:MULTISPECIES: hypothetical protein [Kitasatospora]BAJ32970.1 hypothetical protein KSE_72150 [Kitasatospora setae KM-6054]
MTDGDRPGGGTEVEQQEQAERVERAERQDPRAADLPPERRAARRAALVARIRAANAETLERLADL